MSTTAAPAKPAPAAKAAPAAGESLLAKQRKDLLFGVRRSVRYHRSRVRFFEGVEFATEVLNLLFGTAAVVALLEMIPRMWAVAFAALVSATAAVKVAAGVNKKTARHESLAREFARLEQEIVRLDEPSAKRLALWRDRRLTIEIDEPPTKEVLDIIAHNKLCISMALPETECYHVPWYKRLLAQFVDFNPDGIKKLAPPKESNAELPQQQD